VISTRHDSHAGLVIEALKAGKHVFVEKPLCLTLDELAAIDSVAASAPGRLMVGFNRRFAPQVQRVKKLLAGAGGPKAFVMTVNAGAIPAEHWTQDREIGGGRVVGEACHFIDLLRFLAGHLLANHLLKNGKALFFGGVFFTGPEAERWRARGLEILLREADEQILADGGHYERSPMYHCIVLEDYLDVLNLLQAVPGLVPAEAENRLRAAASRALRFLADITAGDGRIPLFNDAAFGIVAEPGVLVDYGSRVVGAPSGAMVTRGSRLKPLLPESISRTPATTGIGTAATA
jgi:hypothetical protein